MLDRDRIFLRTGRRAASYTRADPSLAQQEPSHEVGDAGDEHQAREVAERKTSQDESDGKPELIGRWRGQIGPGLPLELTFRPNGEMLTNLPFSGFVIANVRNDAIILRSMLERNDQDAPEGRIEFLDQDTIELWPPSGLQKFGEVSYTLSRVGNSLSARDSQSERDARFMKVVGAWQMRIDRPGRPKVRIDFLPDGSQHILLLGQEQKGQWKPKMVDGEALLIEMGRGGNLGTVRVSFPEEGRMILSEVDGSDSQTYTRIRREIN